MGVDDGVTASMVVIIHVVIVVVYEFQLLDARSNFDDVETARVEGVSVAAATTTNVADVCDVVVVVLNELNLIRGNDGERSVTS